MPDDIGKIVCENWVATQCPFCQTINWVYCGDPNDVTGIDIYVCHCYDCKKYFWIDENSKECYREFNTIDDCEDINPDEADYEEGKPTPK